MLPLRAKKANMSKWHELTCLVVLVQLAGHETVRLFRVLPGKVGKAGAFQLLTCLRPSQSEFIWVQFEMGLKGATFSQRGDDTSSVCGRRQCCLRHGGRISPD